MAIPSKPLARSTPTSTLPMPRNFGTSNLPEPEVAIAPGPHLGPDAGSSPLLWSLHGIRVIEQHSP
ncbi:hypothetical protein BDV93DRAFT_561050 [Ceratobasidium sp. AG-I]|nr:hypothetical protein BDV93DRAFT_561050 [Ceratobasidium sp. AG-I]